MSAKHETTAVECLELYDNMAGDLTVFRDMLKPEIMYSNLKLPTSLDSSDFDNCEDFEVQTTYEIPFDVHITTDKEITSNEINVLIGKQPKDRKDSSTITGLMVFYLDVGTLSPGKGQDYIIKRKKQINEDGFVDRLSAQGIECIFMPVRVQETRVEYIKL